MGSTTATITRRYAPHLCILLLEKARFPRHHVGESLLAGASPVLHEMDTYDRVDGACFLEKLGATYIWGQNRQPWGDVETRYASCPLMLKHAEVTHGLYFYQGAVRTTRRIINTQNNGHLDLHPGEEILLNLFDGSHSLAELNDL